MTCIHAWRGSTDFDGGMLSFSPGGPGWPPVFFDDLDRPSRIRHKDVRTTTSGQSRRHSSLAIRTCLSENEAMTTQRADAAARRALILDAADHVFGQHGVTAPLDLVVERAEVGRATLYRQFPDRRALMLALLERSLDNMLSSSRCDVVL